MKQPTLLAGGMAAFPAWNHSANGANSDIRVAVIGLGTSCGVTGRDCRMFQRTV